MLDESIGTPRLKLINTHFARFKQRAWLRAMPYLLIMPLFFLLAAVVIYPTITAIGLSFQHYVLTEPDAVRFIGLENYTKVLNDPRFTNALIKSALWVGTNIVLQLILGLGVALVLNAEFPLRGILRGVILVPWVTPGVVTALMWRFLLNPTQGVVNEILIRFRILDSPIPFISQPNTAFMTVILASVWFGVPFFAIMLLAGLQAIPENLYEAAKVDGATILDTFSKITLPLLWPTILITTFLRILWLAQYVDIIFLITGGGPAYSTTTLPVYAFLIARTQLNFGYSSTIAVLLGVILISISIVYMVFIRKTERY